MNDQGSYQVSQGLEVLQPRSGQAYPIPCEEWSLLKKKISNLSSEPWFYHTLGSLLLGATLSTFTAIILGTYETPQQETALIIAWAVVVTTAISGALSLFFSHSQRAAHRERATDVIAQMDLIEKRYERTSP